VATAEARLFDDAGTLYGHATTTCMIFRRGITERAPSAH
jgi:acyl-coenzyme A thioesterase PaaI-like protein